MFKPYLMIGIFVPFSNQKRLNTVLSAILLFVLFFSTIQAPLSLAQSTAGDHSNQAISAQQNYLLFTENGRNRSVEKSTEHFSCVALNAGIDHTAEKEKKASFFSSFDSPSLNSLFVYTQTTSSDL